MSQHRPTISTHVLDTASGRPRAGVHVRLRRPEVGGDDDDSLGGNDSSGGAPIIGEGVTDDDGRIRDLLGGSTLQPGRYRLEFALDPDGFFAGVTLDFRVDDAGRSCHVPLLLAPFGLTTYRGS